MDMNSDQAATEGLFSRMPPSLNSWGPEEHSASRDLKKKGAAEVARVTCYRYVSILSITKVFR